jgi:hypothetical protein
VDLSLLAISAQITIQNGRNISWLSFQMVQPFKPVFHVLQLPTVAYLILRENGTADMHYHYHYKFLHLPIGTVLKLIKLVYIDFTYLVLIV